MLVELDGSLLMLDDAAVYLDLEAALAASRLVQVRVALAFHGGAAHTAAVRYGQVRGEVAVDGNRWTIDCGAFANLAPIRSPHGHSQTTVTATFKAGNALLSRQIHDGSVARTWRFDSRGDEEIGGASVHVTLDGDGFSPAQLECHLPEGKRLSATPLSRMAILRSTPTGYVRATFGVARYEEGEEVGVGLYEHVVPLAPSS
jgi:hypothetical protein